MAFLICGSDTINKECTKQQRQQKDHVLHHCSRQNDKDAITMVIRRGSTASEAGLQVADEIMSINGVDVSRSIADNVAMAVRKSAKHVVLDIRRSEPEDKLEATKCSQDISTPTIEIRFQELTDDQRSIQRSIHELRSCEEEFVKSIRNGIQTYADPLRSALVSPSEHETLFNNIPKLLSLSDLHLQKLEKEGLPFCDVADLQQRYVDTIGSIYLPQVQLMAEVFGQYCNGIKNSFRLLAELRKYDEFNAFLHRAAAVQCGQLSITEFIQKPLEHIKNMVLILQEILSKTPAEHHDVDNLCHVVDALRNTCNLINIRNTRYSRSMTSLVSRSSRRTSLTSTSSGSSASSGFSSGSSTGSSIDSEVLNIQTRLVFSEHVQAFQLATATRHMIYSGELIHVDDEVCTKLFVVLMSDLLLLTRVEQDNSLLVVDYPILLHDIVETDWTDTTTTDFVIGVESSSNPAWIEPRDVLFTAPSIESKYTWKNILSHRINCVERHENMYNRSKVVV
ncbi:hypothetical protein LSH36_1222g00016 [Paralvinella palmiformis]|uniref:DH domain-containing protein n=1 Tax=Paralvinella palmiformis TaxID=53620 RepID=A0AAD9MP38_9ANNE|nr:hypothetical protein LSH36_1222g00016 [Paralvinella palmiformis]